MNLHITVQASEPPPKSIFRAPSPIKLQSPLLNQASEPPPQSSFKVLDCSLEINEFELQLLCYVHFQTNVLGKGMNPLKN